MSKLQLVDILTSTVAFVLVSSPETYKLTSGFLGEWVSNTTGRPLIGGLVLHSLVFLVVLMIIKMLLPKKTSSYKY
jgi:hypothetical protein